VINLTFLCKQSALQTEKKIDEKYIVPAQTRIGHVHLKVADLDRALAFYYDLLGFEVTTMYGTLAAFNTY
jgi:catechol-2,3-dioxygenase